MSDIIKINNSSLATVKDGEFHFPKDATIDQMVEALPKASEDDVIDQFKILFANMPTRSQEDFEMSLAVAGYLMALDPSPLYAVRGAVKAFIRGEVEGQHKTFRPSPAMFAQEVRRQIFLKVRREPLFERETDEGAEKFTQEQIERNKARIASLLGGSAS